ncbi:MAG TPA: four helix bundle protein [Flavobacteriaceae bacterium]|nr:four helix bundle protein [Flavobacteriaceae bacterium]
MANFEDLLVWQKSMDLVKEIYKITTALQANENYEIFSELRKTAISIPTNIAVGNSKGSATDYIQFIRTARGRLAVLDTQMIISMNLKFIDKEMYEALNLKVTEISKMLNGLINYLNTIK